MERMHFSLRTLLAAVVVVAIGAGLWTAEPSWQLGAAEALLLAWVLGSVVALAVHSLEKMKTFWIGVTSGCTPAAVYCFNLFGAVTVDQSVLPASLPLWLELLIGFLWAFSIHFRAILLSLAFAPVVGLLCVFTHWFLVRPPVPKD